jgi:hypothetical protein
MKLKILKCPSCDEQMVIGELKCPKCDLRVKKDFSPCEFCQLSEDDYEFLKIFLRTQGRITEIEKVLGVSYPTIKQMIEKLLTRLDLSPVEKEDPLNALEEGEISVDEAVAILKQRRKK